jgi:hypothetical protein
VGAWPLQHPRIHIMALVAPVIFQCGNCHRVLSDSNQLLSAVEQLGVIVLDAVVGVAVEEEEEAGDGSQERSSSAGAPAFLRLRCAACEHQVGRVYRQAPSPALAHIVDEPSAPRYALEQTALASYVLGSAGVAAFGAADGEHAADADAADAQQPPPLDGQPRQPPTEQQQQQQQQQQQRVGGLDSAGSASAAAELDAMREQMGQLMRVVLALDQRLRSVEEGGAKGTPSEGDGAAAEEPGSKRPR